MVAAGVSAISVSVALGLPTGAGAAPPAGLTKIKHVVVLMQENRSYDSYFGRLHYQGQPASTVEPTTGNPDPTNPMQHRSRRSRSRRSAPSPTSTTRGTERTRSGTAAR